MERQLELCYAVIRARLGQGVSFRVTGKPPGPGPQSRSRMKKGLTRSSLPTSIQVGTASGSSNFKVDRGQSPWRWLFRVESWRHTSLACQREPCRCRRAWAYQAEFNLRWLQVTLVAAAAVAAQRRDLNFKGTLRLRTWLPSRSDTVPNLFGHRLGLGLWKSQWWQLFQSGLEVRRLLPRHRSLLRQNLSFFEVSAWEASSDGRALA